MIETTASLVVDLGNSATRVITQVVKGGSTGSRKIVSRFSELPNRYAKIKNLVEVPESYLESSADFNEGSVEVNHEDRTFIFEHDGNLFVAGKYVYRERGRDVIRPTAQEKKYNSLTTELAMELALWEGYNAVSDMLNTYPGNLDVTWNITVLIPPADIQLGAEKLSEKIKGIKVLNFHNPELQVNPKIESVKVLAEGFASFLGVLFTPSGQARKEYMELTKSTTLIIDVGAGTTDYSLVKNAEAIEDMKDTVTIGGNNVVQIVRKSLRGKGITKTDEEIQEAVRTGIIYNGAEEVSIVEEINEAKKTIASDIINSIRDYFEYSPIPVTSVNRLLVVGGGSLNSVEGSKAISEYLIEFFQTLSKVSLVKIPTESANSKDYPVGLTARTLNVLGASIVALRNLK